MAEQPSAETIRFRMGKELELKETLLKELWKLYQTYRDDRPSIRQTISLAEAEKTDLSDQVEFFDVHGRKPEDNEHLFETAYELPKPNRGHLVLRYDFWWKVRNLLLHISSHFCGEMGRSPRGFWQKSHELYDLFYEYGIRIPHAEKVVAYIREAHRLKHKFRGGKHPDLWADWLVIAANLEAEYLK